MSKKVNKYLDEAIGNIREDREITRELLNDAINWLSKDDSRHREIGITLSKYVETLQRSNEQLVKVSAIIHKRESSASDQGLSAKDKDDLFTMIKENE